MHTFAIISSTEKVRIFQRTKILEKFRIGTFEQIIIREGEGTISAIRNVQKFLLLGRKKGRFQALVIENIEKLTIPAQQALLKTLEEPPENTIVIIESENQEQILPAILSRSSVIFVPSYLTLEESEKEKMKTFWSDLFRKDSLGVRLKTCANLVTKLENRKLLINWIDKQILFFYSLLKIRVAQKSWGNNFSPKDISLILRLLLFTKKYSQANVNMKILMDNFFIHLPKL